MNRLIDLILKRNQHREKQFFELLYQIGKTYLGLVDKPNEFLVMLILEAEKGVEEIKDELQARFEKSNVDELSSCEEEYIDEMLNLYFDALDDDEQPTNDANLFWEFLGHYLYVQKELAVRLHRQYKGDHTQSHSPPFAYAAFQLLNHVDGLHGINASLELQGFLDFFKKDADRATRGLYHPGDPEYTKDRKFIADTSNPKTQEPKTEAEGLFDELLVKTLHAKFNSLSTDEIARNMYEYDDDLAYIPNAYKQDLENEIESLRAKSLGLTVRSFREQREKINQLEKLVTSGKESPEKLKEVNEEFKNLTISEVSISHTDQTFSEESPSTVIVSNEEVDYTLLNPEEVLDLVFQREIAVKEIEHVISGYINNLSTLAKKQKSVGEFVLEKISCGELDSYLKENKLNATEIHKNSNIPLSTVQRFCEGLKNYPQKQ